MQAFLLAVFLWNAPVALDEFSKPEIVDSDLIWFPPPCVTEAMLESADQHIEWLQSMKKVDPSRRDHWDTWIADAERCRQPWKNLDSSHRALSDSWEKRRYLRFLRMRLGCADYYAGRMPCPLPLYHFQWIDR